MVFKERGMINSVRPVALIRTKMDGFPGRWKMQLGLYTETTHFPDRSQCHVYPECSRMQLWAFSRCRLKNKQTKKKPQVSKASQQFTESFVLPQQTLWDGIIFQVIFEFNNFLILWCVLLLGGMLTVMLYKLQWLILTLCGQWWADQPCLGWSSGSSSCPRETCHSGPPSLCRCHCLLT